MTTFDAWRGHYIDATYIRHDDNDIELVSVRCAGCPAVCGGDDDPQSWFADHLKEVGGIDYAVEFERTWRQHVTDETGNLDEDRVARELFDYGVVMEQASQVYSELAGFSKPNTAAGYVIEYAQRQYDESRANLILHDLLALVDGEANRQAVIDYANGMHKDAYEQYLRDVEMRAKFAAERAEQPHRGPAPHNPKES